MFLKIFLIDLIVMLIAVGITMYLKKRTPWIVIITAALIAVCNMFYGVYISDMRIDEAYIQQMESQQNFSGEEVDQLWRWRHCMDATFGPSERFKKLYDQKIKPIPGSRY